MFNEKYVQKKVSCNQNARQLWRVKIYLTLNNSLTYNVLFAVSILLVRFQEDLFPRSADTDLSGITDLDFYPWNQALTKSGLNTPRTICQN